MKCDSRASLLASTFASPYLSREPNVKVAIETLPFTKIHEVDDHDQWTRHINEIAMKNPPKLLERNHCVNSNQTKINTTRKSVFRTLQVSFTKHQTITFIMKWKCLT
jgi:predicted phosphohydrolase